MHVSKRGPFRSAESRLRGGSLFLTVVFFVGLIYKGVIDYPKLREGVIAMTADIKEAGHEVERLITKHSPSKDC